MKTEKGKVTALDAEKRAVRVDRNWYYANEQELKRLRLEDIVEVTFVTQDSRRKLVEIKLIIDGHG
jgi:hypothetical protein